MDKNKRNLYYDIIRVAALFLVIGVYAVDSIAPYAPDDQLSGFMTGFLDSLNSLGLPFFFALSGLFLLSRPIENFGSWYKTHYLRLFIPYACYGLLYVIYFTGIEQHNPAMIPLAWIRGLLCHDIHPTHWFIYAIAGLYFAAPALNRMFHAMSDREVAIIFNVSLLLILTDSIFERLGLSFGMNSYVFNIDNLLIFITGYCAVRLKDRPFQVFLRKRRIILLPLFIILKYFFPRFPLFVYMIVRMAMQPPEKETVLNPHLSRIITFISMHSYSVYLVHAAVLSCILKFHTDWSSLYQVKILLIYPVVAILSLVLVVIPDRFINRLPARL